MGPFYSQGIFLDPDCLSWRSEAWVMVRCPSIWEDYWWTKAWNLLGNVLQQRCCLMVWPTAANSKYEYDIYNTVPCIRCVFAIVCCQANSRLQLDNTLLRFSWEDYSSLYENIWLDRLVTTLWEASWIFWGLWNTFRSPQRPSWVGRATAIIFLELTTDVSEPVSWG